MSINWTFPSNDGGRDNGLNDPGVETFKGDFDRYLARELGQNSLDARRDTKKPVLLTFDLLELDRDVIPDMDTLHDVFVRSGKFWSHDKKAKEFFKNAEKLAKADTITVLKIGDYHTTGLLGDDEDKTRDWYNLIRCAGASSKGGGEGGSYGIGKKAPFAASLMRTVLYSTRNVDDDAAFIGVCDGATFEQPGKAGKAQGIGFLGGPKGASIRKKTEIPAEFRRKDYGTDLYILGFPKSEDWESDLVYSVLDNFWPSIYFGDLEVRVGEISITKKTLSKLLDKFSTEEKKFTAHLYYKAFTDPTHTFKEELPKLGKVEAYFLAGDPDLPKNIAMVRKTGMIIWVRPFRSHAPYIGVFMCRNTKGNEKLREMEPPKHDVWDANHPEKGANKAVENEYFGFLRECVGKLAPVDESKEMSIPGMSQFLPDDDETPEEEFGEGSDNSDDGAIHEGFVPNALPTQIIPATKIDARKRSMQPDEQKPEDGENETEAGTGTGTGGGPGKNGKNNGGGGGGGGGGGSGKGNAGSAAGGAGGVSSKPSIPIRFRAYCQNSAAGVYALAIKPEEENNDDANLLVWTVGDDQKVTAEIKSAKVAGGADIPVKGGGALGPVKIGSGIKVEVTLRHPVRVAMEVSAHEA